MAIETRGLTKKFGHRVAVNGIDLAVPHASVFGFLGPNGSGKTTTIRMLLGLAGASSGSIGVLGQPMPERTLDVLPRVGALVEGPAFYPYLSGRANLHRLDAASRAASSATRRARIEHALEQVGLGRAAKLPVHAYSLGMKQRLGIANALAGRRELLVLDEPTNGLDPQGTREVRSLIRSLAGGGTTVFVSSHLLGEIEQMCTHAAVMSAGNLVAQGTLAQLRGAVGARVVVHTPDTALAVSVLARFGLETRDGSGAAAERPGPVVSELTDAGLGRGMQGDADAVVRAELPADAVVRAGLSADGSAPEAMVQALVAAGVRVRGFAIEQPSLEERFVALTGEGFDLGP